jgi:hypothetical protein
LTLPLLATARAATALPDTTGAVPRIAVRRITPHGTTPAVTVAPFAPGGAPAEIRHVRQAKGYDYRQPCRGGSASAAFATDSAPSTARRSRL